MDMKTRKAVAEMMIAAIRQFGGDPSTAVITICRPVEHDRLVAKSEDAECRGKSQ